MAAPTSSPLIMDQNTYVMGNVFFFIYHELGHALVELGELPMLGRHEDAVDAFAMVELITQLNDPETDPEARERLVSYAYASIDQWLKSAVEFGDPTADTYFGVHSLDRQRFFRTACLAFGGSSDDFAGIEDAFDLNTLFLEDCRERYFEASDGWTYTLNNFGILESGRGSARDDITFEFLPAEREQHARWQSVASNWIDLDRVQQSFSRSFRLSRPVHITFESCGEENAFYYPHNNSVSICYELMAATARYHAQSTRALLNRGVF